MTALTNDMVVTVDEPEHGVVTVTLNRPRARNALNFESWAGLSAALAGIGEDTRVVVLTGAGGYFSAGGDGKTPSRAGTRAIASVARLVSAQEAISGLRALPIPVVAAVEGGAVGMGRSLVLACDLVVAAQDARFSAPGSALATALELASGIAESGAHAVELTKRLLHAAEHSGFTDYLALELSTAALAQLGPDAERARAAFSPSTPHREQEPTDD